MKEGSRPRQRATKNEGMNTDYSARHIIKLPCKNPTCTCPAQHCEEIKAQNKARKVLFESRIKALFDKYFPPEEIVIPTSCQEDGGICGDLDPKCIKSCLREQ